MTSQVPGHHLQDASLQKFNADIARRLEELKEEHKAIRAAIAKQREEKIAIEQEREFLCEKLNSINRKSLFLSLCRKNS